MIRERGKKEGYYKKRKESDTERAVKIKRK